jgi:hypothetical protein
MLGSHHDGERANAARMADDLVRRSGATWADVIGSPQVRRPVISGSPPWQRMVAYCQMRRLELSPREREFIDTLAKWRRVPTERQQDWLIDIYVRLAGADR